jgi:hypothetical protein
MDVEQSSRYSPWVWVGSHAYINHVGPRAETPGKSRPLQGAKEDRKQIAYWHLSWFAKSCLTSHA